MTWFAISSNEITRYVQGTGTSPEEIGEHPGDTWAVIPRAPKIGESWNFDNSEFTTDLKILADQLCASIDVQRTRRIAQVLGSTPEIREIHRLKQQEAQLGAGPIIEADAILTERSVSEVADEWLARAAEQAAALAEIEPLIIMAKAAIRAASDPAAMYAASQINWSN